MKRNIRERAGTEEKTFINSRYGVRLRTRHILRLPPYILPIL